MITPNTIAHSREMDTTANMLLPLIFLLLAPSSLVVADSYPNGSAALQTWFANSTAYHAFLDLWNSKEHPLSVALEAVRISDSSKISDRCAQDLAFLLSSGSFKTISMLDSSVKYPEGILTGWWTHFGNWDECVKVRDVQSPRGLFNGKMCMVKIYPAIKPSSAEDTYIRGGDASMLSLVSLSLGWCVPSSCSELDASQLLNAALDSLPAVGGVGLAAAAKESDCTQRDAPPLDAADWVAVGVVAALGAALAASTAYDLLAPPGGRRRQLLAAFSVVANGRKLLAIPSGQGDQTLSCLHGLRFLSILWVVLGHRYMNIALTPGVMNLLDVANVLTQWYRIGLTNATLSVDTFFVLSGLLVGYLFFKQAPHKQRLNIPLYYIHRYVRLTPALAMVVLFTATLMFRVGWGPVWESAIGDRRAICRENWWNTLLYIGTFVNPMEQCVAQTWYLMTDMQLHWLSPIFLIALAKKPKVGMMLLAGVCVAGIVGNFVFTYVEDIGGNHISIPDQNRSDYFTKYFYVPFYTRFVPYLEGLALGYVLGSQQNRGDKPPKLGLVANSVAWLSVAAFLLVPLGTGYDFVLTPPPSKLPTAFYNALHRSAWGLGVAGVIWLCATGNGRPVNTFLSWWGFQLLSRFSYSIYLVHLLVQDIQRSNVKSTSYFSDSIMLSGFAGDILLSLVVGGILSITCESPFIVMEKELLGGHAKKSGNERTHTTAPVNSPTSPVATGEPESSKIDV